MVTKGEIINGVKSPLPANGMTIHSSHGLNIYIYIYIVWGGVSVGNVWPKTNSTDHLN